MIKAVCFTGRRPQQLCGYRETSYTEFVNWLTEYTESLYNIGARVFISGGAQGFDQLAFWAVDKLKKKYSDIRNYVYVPFVGQEVCWAKTGLFSQVQYRQMLRRADDVKYLYGSCNDYKEIVDRLNIRNQMMVDAADIVIGLYNTDIFLAGEGGTAKCLRYAYLKNKPIYQLHYTTDAGILTCTGISCTNKEMFI